MLDENFINSLTPEQKEAVKGGLSLFLDSLYLKQYAKTIDDMVESGYTLEKLKNNLSVFVKNNWDDEQISKICNPDDKSHGFGGECFSTICIIMEQRVEQYNIVKNTINQLAAEMSSENIYNTAYSIYTSDKQIQLAISKGFYRSHNDYMERFLEPQLKDPNSEFYKQIYEQIKNRRPSGELAEKNPVYCVDNARGIYEYCQDGDYDYAFEKVNSELRLFESVIEKFQSMEKTPESDALIEAIMKLLPTLYTSGYDLASLHSDPDKAEAIYEEALENRPSTRPTIPKLTKNPFPVSPEEIRKKEEEEARQEEQARRWRKEDQRVIQLSLYCKENGLNFETENNKIIKDFKKKDRLTKLIECISGLAFIASAILWLFTNVGNLMLWLPAIIISAVLFFVADAKIDPKLPDDYFKEVENGRYNSYK